MRTKLFSGFSALSLGLTVLLGVVLLAQLGSVNAGGKFLGTSSVPAARYVGLIDSAVDGGRPPSAQ